MRIGHSSFTVAVFPLAVRTQPEHLDGVAFNDESMFLRNPAQPAFPWGFDLDRTPAVGAHHVVMVCVIAAQSEQLLAVETNRVHRTGFRQGVQLAVNGGQADAHA